MKHWPLVAIAFVAIAAWPLLVQDVFLQRVGALVLLAAISASAWNLLGGYAGQVSVGHAVYFGAGAYASLVVYTQLGWPPIAGAPVGVVVSMAISALVGTPTFRLRGHYFSMATIAAAELFRILAANWPLLGAAVGLMGPPVPRTTWDLSFISPVPYHYLFLAVLVVLLVLTRWMQRSRMGYYLAAIRGGDRAARSLGVRVLRYKLYALLLSAAFTSLAGSLYAVMVGFIDPDSALGILISVKMLIVAALGGAGTLFGPLVGAVILIPLEETTNAMFGGGGTGITFIVYGAIILLVARFQPGGVAAFWDAVTRRIAASRPAFAIVASGLALAPEGWRLFVQQTVEQNLRLGATVLADKTRVPLLLERVFTLFPRLAERRRQRAGTLSGGERQMLATGRALMSDPKLLMLDEPSLGLAPAVVESMYETLVRLRREGLTLLLAEQAVELALEVADYAYVLQTGRTVLEGKAADLADDRDVQRIYLGLETEGR